MDAAIQKFEKYKDKIKNFKNLSEEEQKSLANEIMAETQAAYALSNRCLRARKCMLVPFSRRDTKNSWEGKGCCPGQTLHHLLPDTMFRDLEKTAILKEEWKNDPKHFDEKGKLKNKMPRDKYAKKECWGGYTEGRAPTICMEGTSNHTGSHGSLHKTTGALIKMGKFGREMKYQTARDMIIEQVAAMYGCDKSCLRAQMDAAYKKTYSCGDLSTAKVFARSGENGGSSDSYDDNCDN